MKKIWLALMGMAMALSVSAAEFTEGTQYTKLSTPVANQPEVVEFFSFFCPHCYQFEQVYFINAAIKKSLPEGIKLTKYHVDFLGGELGKEMTKAWAVATSLGIEDKVTPLLFDGLHKTHSINSRKDIRDVFVKVGVTAEEYDSATNSFIVNALVVKQQKAAADFQLQGVPAIFVNGSYMVNNGKLDTSSTEIYAQQFSQVVNYLLTLK